MRRLLSGIMAAVICLFCIPLLGSHSGPPLSGDTSDFRLITDGQRQWLRENSPVRIGVTRIPPQVFRDEHTGELSGLCIDYIKLMERILDTRFEVVFYETWDAMINAGFNRQIDVIYAAQQTPSRQESFLFTRPYLNFDNKIVMAKMTSHPLTLNDLAGQHVAVVHGAAIEEYLHLNYPQIQLVPVDDELVGLLRVSFEQADAMVIEVCRASWYIHQDKIANLRIVGDAGYSFKLGFACRNDKPQIRDILDIAVSNISPAQHKQLVTKWIFPYPEPMPWHRILLLLAIILAGVVGVLLWTLTLRRAVKTRTLELQQREAQLATIFKAAPLGIGLVVNRIILRMNDHISEMTGYALEELIGRDARILYPTQEEYERVGRQRYGQVAGRGVGTMETRWQRKDGKVIDIQINASPIDSDDWSKGAIVTVRDITEQKQAEQMLRFTRFATDHAGEGVFVVRPDARIIYVNDQTCRCLGYSREELLTMTVPDVDPDMPLSRWFEHWRQIVEQGVVRLESRHRAKDGHIIPVAITTNHLVYEGDDYTCAIIRDISERKAAEEVQQMLMEQLEAKNEELQSIIFIASHDLRSPLVNIQGFAGELRKSIRQLAGMLAGENLGESTKKQLETLFNTDVPEALDFIELGSRKMSTLLIGLLRLCRIGTTQIYPITLDMNQLFHGIVDNLRFQLSQLDVRIVVNERLPACMGDAVLINQVFTNLIENAIKYRHPDRAAKICISARIQDAKVVYCVADNGIGIESEYLDKVFEIFYRLNPDNSSAGEGLGLTIVRRILDRQDGRVWIESTPGVGTSVYVQLPRA